MGQINHFSVSKLVFIYDPPFWPTPTVGTSTAVGDTGLCGLHFSCNWSCIQTSSQRYIFWPGRKILPPPSNILPCFCGFFCGIYKGILMCVLSHNYCFSSFPPFSFPFFKSSFKFFPVFKFWKKNSHPPGGGNGQNIYPWPPVWPTNLDLTFF